MGSTLSTWSPWMTPASNQSTNPVDSSKMIFPLFPLLYLQPKAAAWSKWSLLTKPPPPHGLQSRAEQIWPPAC